MRKWLFLLLPVFLFNTFLTGCSTNPVTGKSELSLVSTEQEIAIGNQQYSPSRQTQGGDYVADPAVQKYVSSIGKKLAAVSDRKLPYEFRVINDSTPNAWALPGGKIAINRGLLTELKSEGELAAVLGHEIVHAAARHSARSMQRGIFLQGALIASSIALSDNEYRNLALAGAQIGAGMVNQKYGRDAEREADYYGMQYMSKAGYDPAKAIDLQKTFVRLSKDRKSNWLSGLFASHPPSQERVDNNAKTLAELGFPKGDIGQQRYQKKIARLIKTKPAYKAYDDSKKALKDKEFPKALRLVNKAIRIEPKEALFHGLKGEIRSEQGNDAKAKTNFDRAIALNPNYFKHYLTRGFVNRDLGKYKQAANDFKKSNNLLPTTEGQYGLGWLSMKQGRNQDAINYFRQAANNKTDVGKTAGLYLAKLDLPKNPDRYI
ncbi:MAG: M48 family metalloprotease, partial [Gammaproteobacteria bacterium]|nr:M48 family metalloprotease [Gammaproteobacteria bacterium]